MPALFDTEGVVNLLDEAIREWPEKFQTTTDELLANIQRLFGVCTQALIELSNCTDDNEQGVKDQANSERIVSKVRELRQSLGSRWPEIYNSFGRDIFNVDTYRIEAAEYFQPIPFYPDDDTIVKFYRWSVYDTNGTIVCRYFLEKSEIMPGQPYFVLGKTFPSGHAQIRPYGSLQPNYNQMKIHLIENLKGQGPPPAASLVIPSSNSS
ncbi:unnamed protein product [Adineta ricciae]|uniref:Uncharacterized protein n=1 Tax=Adineta ricciae TaxID=249248 RepID=A0A814VJA9_ADIRI|nr:unnamed protein product [Adineta ricciae]CAF1191523.1 unnamed protein product [Adineta ricciae]